MCHSAEGLVTLGLSKNLNVNHKSTSMERNSPSSQSFGRGAVHYAETDVTVLLSCVTSLAFPMLNNKYDLFCFQNFSNLLTSTSKR